ncbi:subtype B tannase [Mannheimia sp. ZY171111]|uniref:subtype B tannase n=1 Tax=Mannheimia sp. ZY171111 TaxID=2679995 RepID=UPI001ADDBC75|nr:subtype B tannase [Mannheimia sp. ZY171111]QTM00276.1 alpha/beta hydrolase [Mannheimia sp. ZY171111]
MKPKALLAFIVSTIFATQTVATTTDKLIEPKHFLNGTEIGYDLNFNDQNYRTIETAINGEKVRFRAFERIVYVKNPVEPEYQSMNIYVPESYYNEGEINGYKAETAPIFFQNWIKGYMPAKAESDEQKGAVGLPHLILRALSKGYVVVSVGVRGRTLQKEGKYIGKAPAVIMDLKSAVRYLHANDEKMPGDANKIIANGTGAGGAVAALLGASADHFDYEPYFKEIGALKASDKVFAVSAYAPMTNLENADMAYEWQFNGANELAERFPIYLNSLNLTDESGNPLTLDLQGNGSFKDYLANLIKDSANKAYSQLAENSEQQKAFQEISWLSFENNKVSNVDWSGYVLSEKRMKSSPAFDIFNATSDENNLFGTTTENNRHFTLYSAERSSNKEINLADPQIVKRMNPMFYLDNPNAAEHWRIRVGTADHDTSLAISGILAIKLQMEGKNVSYKTPWGVLHLDDDLDELFEWVDEIVKPKP